MSELVKIITPSERTDDGNYVIEPGRIHSFEFEITTDEILRVPVREFAVRNVPRYIRCWISTQANGMELFYRFHPGTGGQIMLFFDNNITPVPEIECGELYRSAFNGMTYRQCEQATPLEPGTYYFNVQNMELHENGYNIGFTKPIICC